MKYFIDLHIHLDGSIPFETFKALIKDPKFSLEDAGSTLTQFLPADLADSSDSLSTLADKSDEELRSLLSVPENCPDLNAYLARFDLPLRVLQTRENLRKVTYDLLREQKQQGVVYTELRFAPQSLTNRGLSQQEVVEAVIDGMNQFMTEQDESHILADVSNAYTDATDSEISRTDSKGVEASEPFVGKEASNQSDPTEKGHVSAPELHVGLILCAMRGKDDEEANLETVRVASHFLGRGVVGIDLAGAEALFPTRDFARIFDMAAVNQIPITIHAGEAAGPESIREALKLGACRIGHGIRAIEDMDLVNELREKGIPLECCPTSNLDTHTFPDMEHYPIRTLLNAGVKVTVNTDNMTVSNTTMPREFRRLEESLGLSLQEERTMYLNAVDAAFCDEAEKIRLRALMS